MVSKVVFCFRVQNSNNYAITFWVRAFLLLGPNPVIAFPAHHPSQEVKSQMINSARATP